MSLIYFKEGWMTFSERTDLTLSAKLIFQVIVGYSQNRWPCNLTVKELGRMNGVSFHTAQDAIKLLMKNEWVSRNKKGDLILTAKTKLTIRAERKKANDAKENIGAESDSIIETIGAEIDSMTISESDSPQGQNLIVIYKDYLKTISNSDESLDEYNNNFQVSNPNKSTKEALNKSKGASPEAARLAGLLWSLILERKPDHRKPNLDTWSRPVDLMLRNEGRTPERIERVIRWTQQDAFWCNNILSTSKLRDKFDQLELKMNSNGKPKPSSASVTGFTADEVLRTMPDPTDAEWDKLERILDSGAEQERQAANG